MSAPAPRAGRSVPVLRLLVITGAAAAVVAIALLARSRDEQRLLEAAAAQPGPASGSVPAGAAPTGDDDPDDVSDPALDALLERASAPDAPVATLDAAAHVLLVREAFEDAAPLVERAVRALPTDAEAAIHRAVLRGVSGDSAGARAELGRLAQGPGGWEASLFAAGFALRDGDEAAALEALHRFRATAPAEEQTPDLAAQIRALEARHPR